MVPHLFMITIFTNLVALLLNTFTYAHLAIISLIPNLSNRLFSFSNPIPSPLFGLSLCFVFVD